MPWADALTNARLPLDLKKIPRAHANASAAAALARMGLGGFEQAYPYQLSGGMAQRAAIARGLVSEPEILLLDEPLGALDALTRIRLQDELLRIWQTERRTIIFVTHDIDEAVQLADRVVVLSSRPARIKDILTIDIPHPRNISSPHYLELRDELLKQIGLAYEI